MSFESVEEILTICKEENCNFYEAVLKEDMQVRGVTKEESLEKMSELYNYMHQSKKDYDAKLISKSGMVGGDGAKVEQASKKGILIGGPFMGELIATGLKIAESNACMKRIVAAPTAGSCGVVPAVFLTMEHQLNLPYERMIEALYVVAGMGEVIATRAFISGAEGGCQAEIGSASAMAAAGACYLMGGSTEACCHATSIALKNLMGLACDPVAGLVEVPCVKRNASGAVNAIVSADMALSGVTSAIPTDQVIDAMRSVGVAMPPSIRETAEGGLAVTPTGLRIAQDLEQSSYAPAGPSHQQ